MEHDPHNAQNWCPDPFGMHEARWFSNGTPTALVRDGGVESRDDPPRLLVDRCWELPSIEPHDPAQGGPSHRFRRRRSQVRSG